MSEKKMDTTSSKDSSLSPSVMYANLTEMIHFIESRFFKGERVRMKTDGSTRIIEEVLLDDDDPLPSIYIVDGQECRWDQMQRSEVFSKKMAGIVRKMRHEIRQAKKDDRRETSPYDSIEGLIADITAIFEKESQHQKAKMEREKKQRKQSGSKSDSDKECSIDLPEASPLTIFPFHDYFTDFIYILEFLNGFRDKLGLAEFITLSQLEHMLKYRVFEGPLSDLLICLAKFLGNPEANCYTVSELLRRCLESHDPPISQILASISIFELSLEDKIRFFKALIEMLIQQHQDKLCTAPKKSRDKKIKEEYEIYNLLKSPIIRPAGYDRFDNSYFIFHHFPGLFVRPFLSSENLFQEKIGWKYYKSDQINELIASLNSRQEGKLKKILKKLDKKIFLIEYKTHSAIMAEDIENQMKKKLGKSVFDFYNLLRPVYKNITDFPIDKSIACESFIEELEKEKIENYIQRFLIISKNITHVIKPEDDTKSKDWKSKWTKSLKKCGSWSRMFVHLEELKRSINWNHDDFRSTIRSTKRKSEDDYKRISKTKKVEIPSILKEVEDSNESTSEVDNGSRRQLRKRKKININQLSPEYLSIFPRKVGRPRKIVGEKRKVGRPRKTIQQPVKPENSIEKEVEISTDKIELHDQSFCSSRTVNTPSDLTFSDEFGMSKMDKDSSFFNYMMVNIPSDKTVLDEYGMSNSSIDDDSSLLSSMMINSSYDKTEYGMSKVSIDEASCSSRMMVNNRSDTTDYDNDFMIIPDHSIESDLVFDKMIAKRPFDNAYSEEAYKQNFCGSDLDFTNMKVNDPSDMTTNDETAKSDSLMMSGFTSMMANSPYDMDNYNEDVKFGSQMGIDSGIANVIYNIPSAIKYSDETEKRKYESLMNPFFTRVANDPFDKEHAEERAKSDLNEAFRFV